MLHQVLTVWALPIVMTYLFTTIWFSTHGRKKTAHMVDMIYAALWFTWSITGPGQTWAFGLFWAWYFRRSYRRWKNSNDNDKNLKKRLMAASSRMKAKLVERMRKMKPSPLPSPVPA